MTDGKESESTSLQHDFKRNVMEDGGDVESKGEGKDGMVVDSENMMKDMSLKRRRVSADEEIKLARMRKRIERVAKKLSKLKDLEKNGGGVIARKKFKGMNVKLVYRFFPKREPRKRRVATKTMKEPERTLKLLPDAKFATPRRHRSKSYDGLSESYLRIPLELEPFKAKTLHYSCIRDWIGDNEDHTREDMSTAETKENASARPIDGESSTWEMHRINVCTESEWRRLASSTLGRHLESIWKRCFPLPPWRKHLRWGDPKRFPLGHLCAVVCLIVKYKRRRDVIGLCCLEQRMQDPFGGDVFLHDICVLPEWRRANMKSSHASRTLMRGACDAAHDVIFDDPISYTYHCGVVRLEVNAHQSSRLIAFYESCGFTRRRPSLKDVQSGFVDRRNVFERSFWVRDAVTCDNVANAISTSSSSLRPKQLFSHPNADVRACLNDLIRDVVSQASKRSNRVESRKRGGLFVGSSETLSPRRASPRRRQSVDMTPVMRGTLSWTSDGKCVWAGTWAISEDEYDNGVVSNFRYVSFMRSCCRCGRLFKHAAGLKIHKRLCRPTDSTSKRADNNVVTSYPVSGRYIGYFAMNEHRSAESKVERVHERSIRLRFLPRPLVSHDSSTFNVQGRGRNVYGRFVLWGQFDGSSSTLSLRRTYKKEDEHGPSSDISNDLDVSDASDTSAGVVISSVRDENADTVRASTVDDSKSGVTVRLRRVRHFVDQLNDRYEVLSYDRQPISALMGLKKHCL